MHGFRVNMLWSESRSTLLCLSGIFSTAYPPVTRIDRLVFSPVRASRGVLVCKKLLWI